MLITMFLLAAAAAIPVQNQPVQAEKDASKPVGEPRPSEESVVAERCVAGAQNPDDKVKTPHGVTPGLPPLFSFRFYEGKLHGRFNHSDLMLDDAGH